MIKKTNLLIKAIEEISGDTYYTLDKNEEEEA
jgi:hypothetical protein